MEIRDNSTQNKDNKIWTKLLKLSITARMRDEYLEYVVTTEFSAKNIFRALL